MDAPNTVITNAHFKNASDFGRSLCMLTQFPMTNEESEFFIVMNMVELDNGDGDLPSDLEPIKNTFMYQVLSKRLAFHGIPVKETVIAFLASICDSPGKAVMYCAALKYIMDEQKPTKIGMMEMALAFQSGFPRSDDMAKLWELQKASPEHAKEHRIDNWLDIPSWW